MLESVRLRVLSLVLLFGLFAAASLSAEVLHQEWSESFPIEAGKLVSVENLNGSLEFTSWDSDEVRVEATKMVKTMGRDRAESAMKEIAIEVEHTTDGLHISTVLPKRRSGSMSWLFGREVQYRVSYRLTLPREVGVKGLTVNGNVEIDSVSGRIEAETTNGQIRIVQAAGPARAHTINGNIRAELVAVDQASDCDFRTTNGGITVYLPADVQAYVVASTVHGAVNTDFAVLVEGGSDSWRRRSLRGTLNGGGSQLKMETVNGSIQLRKRDGAQDVPEADGAE